MEGLAENFRPITIYIAGTETHCKGPLGYCRFHELEIYRKSNRCTLFSKWLKEDKRCAPCLAAGR